MPERRFDDEDPGTITHCEWCGAEIEPPVHPVGDDRVPECTTCGEPVNRVREQAER